MRLVTIVPVYNTPDRNRTSYLMDAVESDLAQNIDHTLLIVDNGSTDEDTLDFYETLKDPRVRVNKIGRIPGQKETPSRSLNFGFNLSFDGGYDAFCYLHSDDLLTEDSLEMRVEALREGNDMTYGKAAFLFGSKVKYRKFPADGEDTTSQSVLRSGFPHHSSMWSRKIVEQMLNAKRGKLFDEGMLANEDLPLTLYCRNFIGNGFNLGFVDNIVYIWRDHPFNITHAVDSRVRMEQSRYAYEQNGLEFPSEYTWRHTLRHLGSRFISAKLKEPLRPLRDKISRVTKGKLFPSEPLREIDLNPYWFRELVPS